jgi:hypothetical protein
LFESNVLSKTRVFVLHGVGRHFPNAVKGHRALEVANSSRVNDATRYSRTLVHCRVAAYPLSIAQRMCGYLANVRRSVPSMRSLG